MKRDFSSLCLWEGKESAWLFSGIAGKEIGKGEL